jgi:very-short-patch-repair endonuclease
MNTAGIVFGRKVLRKREAVARLRRQMTPAETHLWQFLRANRLADAHFPVLSWISTAMPPGW